MNARKLMIGLTAVALIVAVIVGMGMQSPVNALGNALPQVNKLSLENVRDYAAAVSPEGQSYAVDGGLLYAGRPLDWSRVNTPEGVIVNAVALDSKNLDALYIGAANELALYRSLDRGESWNYIPLTDQYVGGVTDVAFDSETRLMYVATDTAGLFRLRDVGTSVTSGGHFMVYEPVLQVAADSTGAGMAFFRTANTLYRSENGGLAWMKAESLTSAPTAIAIANSKPPVVYVGTVDRGVQQSADGVAWMSANDGLNLSAGSRLRVDALTVDPQQPSVLYVATSFLFGSTTLTATPNGVAMTSNGGNEWAPVVRSTDVPVAELYPLSGVTGAVYSVSNLSRSPMALGVAPAAPELTADASTGFSPADNVGGLIAWSVALLASVWLAALVAAELRSRPTVAARPAAQLVRSNR